MHVTRRFCRLSAVAFLLALAVLSPQKSTSQAPPATGSTGSTGPNNLPKIKWIQGPIVGKLGDIAEIKVPAGYEFADGDGARQYMENTGNPSSGKEVGLVTPIADDKDNDWVILFEFDESGYVKDDEKSSIDASALLDSLKRGTEADNEERKKRGWIPFHIDSWQTLPFYDESTHNLTWGTVGHDDRKGDIPTINYETRYLGRRGVMHVDLITDPNTVGATLPRFKTVMGGFAYTNGSRYADFVSGDKVAEYGLTALIAGGATAVALKTGLFAKLIAMLAALWKFLALAFAALLSRIKNIVAAIKNKFRRKGSINNSEELAPPSNDTN